MNIRRGIAAAGAATFLAVTLASCSDVPIAESPTSPNSTAPSSSNASPFAQTAPRKDDPLRRVAHVQRVIDGDTFVTSDNARVRVLGIDSCESNTAGGQRAKKGAEELILNQDVTLHSEPGVDLDRYQRQLRYVDLPNGSDFAADMVVRDDTYVYPKRNDANAAYVQRLRSLDTNGRVC